MKVKVILMDTERKKRRFHSRRSYAEHIDSVSASFKFGKHSEYEPQSKQGEIESMKAQIAELTARLDAVSK